MNRPNDEEMNREHLHCPCITHLKFIVASSCQDVLKLHLLYFRLCVVSNVAAKKYMHILFPQPILCFFNAGCKLD